MLEHRSITVYALRRMTPVMIHARHAAPDIVEPKPTGGITAVV